MNEQELLEKLINSGLLGKGDAKFEVNVGIRNPKFIDMVFENANEIWLIEAKRILDHGSRGQILNYKDLYNLKKKGNKPVRVGIVCEQTESDIEHVCRTNDIKIFLYERDFDGGSTSNTSTSKNFVCGTCGDVLKEKDRELICETCEHFFGTSGVIIDCLVCRNKFALFIAIDERSFNILPTGGVPRMYSVPSLSVQDRKLWRDVCPECREKQWPGRNVGTTKDIIKCLISSTFATFNDFEIRGISKEFIEYCLGKRKFH